MRTITTTSRALAVALWGADVRMDACAPDGAYFDREAGCFRYGPGLPRVRTLTGDEQVVLTIDGHRVVISDSEGGWVADRFGRLGARESRKVIAAFTVAA